LTAATTGLGEFSINANKSAKDGLADMAGNPNSLTSAPPQNALPDPTITTARIDSSPVARSTPSATAVRRPRLKALTGGFFKVITATAPREV
jgi:hypothetical protein